MQDIPALAAAVYHFLQKVVLSSLSYPQLDDILRQLQEERAVPPYTYIDLFPSLTCVAAGGSVKRAIPLSAAWTLYILAARLFDDLQDDIDDGLAARYGPKASVSLGLATIGAANAALSHLETDNDTLATVYGSFGEVLILAAQAQQVRGEGTVNSLESYFRSVAARSGMVFATGAWCGGRLATDIPEVLEALYEYGLNLGMAMQIADDCKDLVTHDVGRRTITLPILYALSQENHPAWTRLAWLLEQSSGEKEIEEILSILSQMKAVTWSLEVAAIYKQRAISALLPLPEEPRERLAYFLRPHEHTN